jgi:2-polyprenyl-3-methyl-5-hydroxy-6-metoxy-1,4-benzoquinol methylase
MSISRDQQREKYEQDSRYHAEVDDFDNIYSLRSEAGRYFELRRLSCYLSIINRHRLNFKDTRILDLGCHHGFYANLFAYLKRSSDDVCGYDFIDTYLDVAKRVNSSIEYSQQDVFELDDRNGQVDFILLNYLFGCIPEADAPGVAARIDSVLKPDGHILFFDFYNSKLFYGLARLALGKEKARAYPAYDKQRLSVIFPNLKVIESRQIIPAFWNRLIRWKCPYFFLDMIEPVWMRRYFVALMQKPSA